MTYNKKYLAPSTREQTAEVREISLAMSGVLEVLGQEKERVSSRLGMEVREGRIGIE
jgi:hypothetical protein